MIAMMSLWATVAAAQDAPPVLRWEASLEAGALMNHDPSYALFADGDVMGSLGASAGFRISRNAALVGSWQRVRRGADVNVVVPDDDADFTSRDQSFVAALIAHQGTAGLKLDFGIAQHLRPYVAGQAMAVVTKVRFDDDPEVRDNPGQVQGSGLALGALLTFGAELRVPVSEQLQPAVYLAMGPSWLSETDLGDLGQMQMGGFTLRTGVGLRF